MDGGAPQSMGIRMPGVTAPSLNADGRRILFSAGESSNELWALRNLPLNQGHEEPIRQAAPGIGPGTAADHRGPHPRFTGRVTPDGTLFPFFDQSTGDISLRDLRTGEVRRVTSEGKPGQPGGIGGDSPVPSRDGKQLAYGWRHRSREAELRVIAH